MCHGCYAEAGSPAPSDNARAVGVRLRDVDPYGGCHIVREDWSLESDCIEMCINDPDTTDSERAVMRDLLALSEQQRFAAMAVADEYI